MLRRVLQMDQIQNLRQPQVQNMTSENRFLAQTLFTTHTKHNLTPGECIFLFRLI
jgi:hypothetical protein